MERDKLRQLAFLVSVVSHSILGTCDRKRVSCGIVKDKRLRGMGFNGSVNGAPHCDQVGHRMVEGHCERTVHAEENATHNTDRGHLKGAKAIVTTTPCIRCMQTLAQAGVKDIDVYSVYPNARGNEQLNVAAQEAKIRLHQHEIDWQKTFQKLFDLLAGDGGVLKNAGYSLKVTKDPL